MSSVAVSLHCSQKSMQPYKCMILKKSNRFDSSYMVPPWPKKENLTCKHSFRIWCNAKRNCIFMEKPLTRKSWWEYSSKDCIPSSNHFKCILRFQAHSPRNSTSAWRQFVDSVQIHSLQQNWQSSEFLAFPNTCS